MSEHVHPDNPLGVSLNFKEIAPALLQHITETLAFLAVPVNDNVPSGLIMHAAHQWALRITQGGAYEEASATVWELSVMIKRMADGGIPFPPYDITTQCGDDGCDVDHHAQTRVINDLFASAHTGRPQDAVRSYVRYVHTNAPDEWADARTQYLAMLVVHTAGRVCDYRSSLVPDLPSLDGPEGV